MLNMGFGGYTFLPPSDADVASLIFPLSFHRHYESKWARRGMWIDISLDDGAPR